MWFFGSFVCRSSTSSISFIVFDRFRVFIVVGRCSGFIVNAGRVIQVFEVVVAPGRLMGGFIEKQVVDGACSSVGRCGC